MATGKGTSMSRCYAGGRPPFLVTKQDTIQIVSRIRIQIYLKCKALEVPARLFCCSVCYFSAAGPMLFVAGPKVMSGAA